MARDRLRTNLPPENLTSHVERGDPIASECPMCGGQLVRARRRSIDRLAEHIHGGASFSLYQSWMRTRVQFEALKRATFRRLSTLPHNPPNSCGRAVFRVQEKRT